MGTHRLEAFVETESRHCGEPKGVQEVKREKEIGPLVHGEVCAVATVDRETEFPQTEPGKRRPVAFPHPGIGGVFDAKLGRPDKGSPHVAEGFEDRLGVTQRNARAEDQ